MKMASQEGHFEEEYQDVLQNIESAIVHVSRRQQNLLDYDVEEALDALISDYRAEQPGRTPKPHRLTERPERVYGAVRQVCEWRLGRLRMLEGQAAPEAKTPEEIMACLKCIRRSVQRWNKRSGRQGYLLHRAIHRLGIMKRGGAKPQAHRRRLSRHCCSFSSSVC